MNTNQPRISIGLPVFNGETYIEEALDSILAQTYTDFELIISDNASTDRTPEICQGYAAKDSRIRYFRNPENLGGVPNYNRTFELSGGEYFKWAAHDDVLAPGFLKECVRVLDERPDVILAHSKTKIIDEESTVTENYDVRLRTDSEQPSVRFHDLIWVRHWCVQVFGLIRRSALEMTRLHGEYVSSDRVLLIELALRGPFHEVPEYLFFSRRHGQQGSKLVRDLHAYSAWFDSSRGRRLIFPASKLALEHFRAVRNAPLGRLERARCLLSGFLRVGKYSRILVKDAIMAVSFIRDRSEPGA